MVLLFLCIARVREIVAGSLAAAFDQVRRERAAPMGTAGPSRGSGNLLQEAFRERIGEVTEAKMALINSADLARIHHEVHAAIGEENWEQFAKPEFLREIQRRTRESSGSTDPTWQEVVAWVQGHPDEANALLESYKDDPRFQQR